MKREREREKEILTFLGIKYQVFFRPNLLTEVK
jgi:hypothetical protein